MGLPTTYAQKKTFIHPSMDMDIIVIGKSAPDANVYGKEIRTIEMYLHIPESKRKEFGALLTWPNSLPSDDMVRIAVDDTARVKMGAKNERGESSSHMGIAFAALKHSGHPVPELLQQAIFKYADSYLEGPERCR